MPSPSDIPITPDRDWEADTKPGDSLWITVAKTSVCIRHTDDGVSVDLYPVGQEDESLSGAWVTHAECEPDEDA